MTAVATASWSFGEHGPEEVVEKQVFGVELLAFLKIESNHLRILGLRKMTYRTVARLVNVRDTTVLQSNLIECKTKRLPLRVLRVLVRLVKGHHVGTARTR